MILKDNAPGTAPGRSGEGRLLRWTARGRPGAP